MRILSITIPRSNRTLIAALALVMLPCAIPCLADAPASPDNTQQRMPRPFGFSQLWYQLGADSVGIRDQARVARARVGVMGDAAPKLGYLLLAEWGDLNPSGVPGRLSMVDAHATYRFHPRFNLRLGQDWYKFSLSGSWAVFELPFILRPEAVDGIWLTMGRRGNFSYDRGLWAFGNLDSGPIPINYQLSYTGGAGINGPDDNRQKDITARIQAEALPGVLVGASAFSGFSRVSSVNFPGQAPDLRERAFGLDAMFSYAGRARLITEYLTARYNGSDLHGIGAVAPGGFYVTGIIRPFADGTLSRADLRARYSEFDADANRASATAQTWAIGATYDFGRFTSLKLDYYIRTAQPNYLAASARSNRGNLLLLQLQVWFFPPEMANRFLRPLSDARNHGDAISPVLRP